jgi:hypothetical protein
MPWFFPFQIPQIKLEKVVYQIVLHKQNLSFTAKHFFLTACEIIEKLQIRQEKTVFFVKVIVMENSVQQCNCRKMQMANFC